MSLFSRKMSQSIAVRTCDASHTEVTLNAVGAALPSSSSPILIRSANLNAPFRVRRITRRVDGRARLPADEMKSKDAH